MTSILDHLYVDSSLKHRISVIVLENVITDHQPLLIQHYGTGIWNIYHDRLPHIWYRNFAGTNYVN
ncbi:Hypothetical protein FKW44_021228 [Caligus rogercresseyi]|uniref:Uncharacterized protein n=1 Tax=Caligus rogercresseyi TaxID=217165 RepID=A0A7T8JW94_CALRO|nr:Hypothetical protein FKW44_021228 [Caligus rogercresseyi]